MPGSHPRPVTGRPVVLIGPMAVGKSALGQELAQQLNVPFIDTDQQVVERHGPIPDLFRGRGERYFREVEAKAVAQALETAGKHLTVISLGGGAVLDSGTQQLLADTTVVFLEADIDAVRGRITRTHGRPLLTGDPVRRWTETAQLRLPVYRRLADLTLDVRAGSIEELVHNLRLLLDEYNSEPKENLQ